MAEIEKGTISSVNGSKAAVVPSFSDAPVTAELTVPFYLVRCLEVGMEVVYAMFEDNTGLILGRLDGDWNHDLDGDVRIRGDVQTAAIASINAHTHSAPGGQTGTPS